MDGWMDKQADKTKIKEMIHRLEHLCFEYPPDLAEIENLLKKIPDISILYSAHGSENDEDYVWMCNDFLSALLEDYFDRINEKWYEWGLEQEQAHEQPAQDGQTADIQQGARPRLHREIYAKDIIQLLLRYGYDLTAVDGKVGAACLHALVWSNFNQDMAEIAKLFLDAGADPLISYYGEEDSSTLDCIEFHRCGTDWYFGEGEDCDYFDNRSSLDIYYDLCQEAVRRRQGQL